MEYIIGNLCSLGAMVTDTVSASCKSAKKMLLVQILSQFIYGVGAIALKGYSAAVQNAMAVLRNLAAIRNIQSKWVEWGLVAAGVVLGLVFNNLQWLGLLPVIANLVYSIIMFRFPDNERALKAAFIFNVILYAIFNAAIWNVVGAITNTVLAISTAIFLVRDVRRAKQS
jgi:hypothetical protein